MAWDNTNPNTSVIWSRADLLSGDFKPSEYGKIVGPLKILRRLHCLFEPTRKAVVAAVEIPPEQTDDRAAATILTAAGNAGGQICNQSFVTLSTLRKHDACELRADLVGGL